MKALAVLSSLLAPAAAVAIDSKLPYDGHRVFRVRVADDGSHVQSVIDKLQLTTWQPPSRKGAFADIQVAPRQLEEFHKAMDGQDLTTMHHDLGKSIKREGTFMTYAAGSANDTWFTSYHGYDDHVQWLNDLGAKFSKNAKTVTSGTTLEGNPITGLHIFGSSGGGKKPAVVFHGTVHAREWIASMVGAP